MSTIQQHSTKQDILKQLLKQGQATALELSNALDMTPQGVRRHLKDLELEGLIRYESVQLGMGRPQHVYQLTGQGRDRFPHRYDEFALSFLDTLAETVGQEQVSQILHKQWQRKAREYQAKVGQGSVQERVANLVELRKAEGYMAEWYAVEVDGAKSEAQRYILAEHNCAISSVAESFPSVCGHELEMFGAVLPDCNVERTHWIVNGEHRCGYMITRD
ncbi:MAG: iron-sulfur cluster biosynthesis transcriptional regulator SufR [Oscillatoriales cyanobacterium RM2_1_1]|nr:iron-sulfur cluster biosynthesis transcriptional regulator SufR [Oscillatoriales cyanobacterium SM2_3_0]NJO47532.1 iron-sulfur cluster biosynthesis transcriptional regulator SufR [Oscillatoriales cyanobacterium RM2_1_1]